MNGKKVPKGRKARYVVISLSAVLIALFVLLRFNPARAGNAPAEVAGTVVSLNIAETVEASGSLEAQPFAGLRRETSGVVEEVYVKAGDKAGQRRVSPAPVCLSLKMSPEWFSWHARNHWAQGSSRYKCPRWPRR